MVDLFKMLEAKDPLGFTPSLTITIEVTLPDMFRYSLAGFADGFIIKDDERENWRKIGNIHETLSFNLYGRVVENDELSDYRVQIMVNPNGSIYQFENIDRGVIGFGWLNDDREFLFNMTFSYNITKNLLNALQRNSFNSNSHDKHTQEVVRLQMSIINLRHPQEGGLNVGRSICNFDLFRIDL